MKTALRISNNVEIGLTSDELLKNKEVSEKLEDYETRKKAVEYFIKSLTELNRINLLEVRNWDDMVQYVLQPNYEGLIVSQESYENGLKLSETREENNLPPLILIVIPMIKDKEGEKISSTSIRKRL